MCRSSWFADFSECNVAAAINRLLFVLPLVLALQAEFSPLSADVHGAAELHDSGESGEDPAAARRSDGTRTPDDPPSCSLGWLVGSWFGQGLGGSVTETWVVDWDGALVGMFTLWKEEAIELLELRTIERSGGLHVLHLRDLTRGEQEDRAYSWPEIESGESWVDFGRVRYEAFGGDSLRAVVRTTTGRSEVIALVRAAPPMSAGQMGGPACPPTRD